MRKIFSLLFYLMMIATGIPLAGHAVLYGGRGIGIAGGVFLALFGGYICFGPISFPATAHKKTHTKNPSDLSKEKPA